MNPKEFKRRRRDLMRMMGKGGIAILPSAPTRLRNRDVGYAYRQDSDFYYLTGLAESESVTVLIPGRAAGECLIFCQPADFEKEIWDGKRVSPLAAKRDYGADQAFSIDLIDDQLPDLIQQCERIYYTMGVHPEFDKRLINWVADIRQRSRGGVHAPDEIIALDHILHDLRLYKSRSEISAMRKSAKIAIKAHERAIQRCKPGMHEYELEAEYIYEFRKHGVDCSYQPIVGGGSNACILHYVDNNQLLVDGDLVLADVGCEYNYYASDVTRTWPINGKFSIPQRELYEIVLEAHDAAIEKVQPGNHWNDPHDAALRVISKGLLNLGLLKGKLQSVIKSEAYREFFMHRTGHWLGMDVHDVGDYKVSDQWRLLEPGMILTVEPGIYVRSKSKAPARFRNIGIRIEDDVLVTKQGHDVLTAGLVTNPDELESLIGSLSI
ncbi:MAG: aminopeptidase P N-terminal domain-containing protein [Pseudomonadota bacterium]|nr:aminopeptidase P N-terminal domain-containing protein [Pseudomonadota bacterium]